MDPDGQAAQLGALMLAYMIPRDVKHDLRTWARGRMERHEASGGMAPALCMDDTLVHEIGLMGEYAVAMFLGLDPEQHGPLVPAWGKSDGGADIRLGHLGYRQPGGLSVQVKTRVEFGRPDVIIDQWYGDSREIAPQSIRANILVSASLTARDKAHAKEMITGPGGLFVVLDGFMLVGDIPRHMRSGNLGHGMRWLIAKSDLQPMQDLILYTPKYRDLRKIRDYMPPDSW